MVGRHLWMNLHRLTFWFSVFVLKAILMDCQSTVSKICLVQPVLWRMYSVKGGAYMSLVIWVFSFLLLVVPLEMKYALTMFGRSGVCVGRCFLSGWV